MPLYRGAAVPGFGLGKIGRNAAAELVRLAEIELRVGVAGDRERAPFGDRRLIIARLPRSEEHTSELQSLMRISYAVFCLKKKNHYVYLHIDHNSYYLTLL